MVGIFSLQNQFECCRSVRSYIWERLLGKVHFVLTQRFRSHFVSKECQGLVRKRYNMIVRHILTRYAKHEYPLHDADSYICLLLERRVECECGMLLRKKYPTPPD